MKASGLQPLNHFLEGSTAFRHPATKTGFIEGAILLGLTSAGVSGLALTISTTLLTTVAVGAISVGLNLLAASIFRPSMPKPEDVQTSVRQPFQPRARHYGRVKVSGPWLFGESKDGDLYKILALGQGPVDAIEQFWLDDTRVTLDENDLVTEEPWDGEVNIWYRLGAATETAYSEFVSKFPEFTSAHRGDGIATIAVRLDAPSTENYYQRFPNGVNTAFRVVMRGAKVFNPVSEVTAWNDRAAAIIRDYMTHSDGMRLPESIFTTPLATAGWKEAFNRCAETIDLKDGGREARYRLWGSYYLNERPADVLGRMLASCDGRLYPTPDGGLTLDIGEWQEPTVTLDADAIVGFSEVSRGRDILTTANTIRATYLGTDQDYQTADADPWVDEEDVSDRGETAIDKQFIMSPSHSQARRLMKLEAYRANPEWVGSFQCNLRGLAALGERFVRIEYPLFGIDDVFEVQDFKFIIGEGNILQGVTLQLQSMPEAAYQWDPDQEEGSAPVSDDTDVDRTIPLPEDFDVTIRRKDIGGSPTPFAVLSFATPPDGLTVEAQGKRTADSQWIPIGVQDGATEAESFALSDGEEYEFQVRHSTVQNRKGDWTDSIVITPVADETAPGSVTNVGAVGGTGQVTLSWNAPNSANYFACNIYRNTVDDEGTATLEHVEYGAPSATDGFVDDEGLLAGTYYYFLRARNPSGVESASVATGAVVVS